VFSSSPHPLDGLAARLQRLLPADLYASVQAEPTPPSLTRVFEHLRTLQRVLHDYAPRPLADHPPTPGQVRYAWQEGTLMFTDLAGFTSLMEATATLGRASTEVLLSVLNSYFAAMIEIISKSGGELLEFTGDALLAQFTTDQNNRAEHYGNETARAVRAGLRMQRAMLRFANIFTPQGTLALQMRVGIHSGRFLVTDIGSVQRMEHVLLGETVQRAKQAEQNGQVQRVGMTREDHDRVQGQFTVEPGEMGFLYVVDNLNTQQLGEYDIVPINRRPSTALLWDRSLEGLRLTIEKELDAAEPLVSFLPATILELIVGSAARRKIPPAFVTPTVLFVNLLGPAECVDQALPNEEGAIVACLSNLVTQINQTVEAHGGVLKKVTCHLSGSDMVIYFGIPEPKPDDTQRAALAAIEIRRIIMEHPSPLVNQKPAQIACQVGMTYGSGFAAEIGEPHGRREFNVLGDPVNIASRLMMHAAPNQILVNASVVAEIGNQFNFKTLGEIRLKGKTVPTPAFELVGIRT